MKKIPAYLLVLGAIGAGVLLFEGLYRVVQLTKAVRQVSGTERIIFADGAGTIFENHADIFTYVPHNDIRYVGIFFSDHGFEIEYDYRIHTNNFGLVQQADIGPEHKSLLLLGDSFTEGMGAAPWFAKLAPEIQRLGYQPINGGLLGTGFQHWSRLDHYLAAADIDIAKVAVVFISNDFIRPVWNFTPNNLNCLASLAACQLDRAVLYRLPADEDFNQWIERIRQSRIGERSAFEETFASFLPASFHVYKFVSQKLGNSEFSKRLDEAAQISRSAIAEIVNRHGSRNVAFVHLPQKDEIDRPGSLGLEARRAISDAGGQLFDGFSVCGLTAADYFRNDDHPNADGYVKIARCLTDIVGKIAG